MPGTKSGVKEYQPAFMFSACASIQQPCPALWAIETEACNLKVRFVRRKIKPPGGIFTWHSP